MKELKPFDLEAAKHGDPICFSDGERLHFVGTSVYGYVVVQPIMGGDFLECEANSLRMAPKKRTEYWNLYRDGVSFSYQTEQDAIYAAANHAVAIAVPVEIEE